MPSITQDAPNSVGKTLPLSREGSRRANLLLQGQRRSVNFVSGGVLCSGGSIILLPLFPLLVMTFLLRKLFRT
jgi:hypothetical protein